MADIIDFKVFGSRARGESDEYSDLDIFVKVKRMNRTLKNKMSEIAWSVGFENYLVISVLIFTEDELERTALRSSPLVRNIDEEGIAV